jgi:hypothetical protein
MRRFVLPIILSYCAVTACSDAGPREFVAPPPVVETKICSWESGLKEIFETKCGACHPGTQTTNYKTYSTVKAGITAVVDRINTETEALIMPPSLQRHRTVCSV